MTRSRCVVETVEVEIRHKPIISLHLGKIKVVIGLVYGFGKKISVIMTETPPQEELGKNILETRLSKVTIQKDGIVSSVPGSRKSSTLGSIEKPKFAEYDSRCGDHKRKGLLPNQHKYLNKIEKRFVKCCGCYCLCLKEDKTSKTKNAERRIKYIGDDGSYESVELKGSYVSHVSKETPSSIVKGSSRFFSRILRKRKKRGGKKQKDEEISPRSSVNRNTKIKSMMTGFFGSKKESKVREADRPVLESSVDTVKKPD